MVAGKKQLLIIIGHQLLAIGYLKSLASEIVPNSRIRNFNN